jgi:L-ornithine N5-oxygenase
MSAALAHDDEVAVYDVVGVGFGPSNLALAVAITEQNERSLPAGATTAVFLERQPGFGWHRGMLIDDATMQVSFLKDLVTLRDPTSEFSFLCYLQGRDRLVDFINHKNLYPLRVEFHDYLEWAAAKVDDVVCYGHEVVAVRPVVDGSGTGCLDVTARTPHGSCVYRARNLVLGTGLEPCLPDGVSTSDRVWHNCDLLGRVERLAAGSPRRFVVVGAGQSAAEVTSFLHRRFAAAEVCAVFSRYGYSPADDSSFANRIFDPAAVGEFFGAPPDVKRLLLDYHSNTNYSVVDGELIDDLYRRVYQEKVLGTERLRLFNASRLVEVAETGTGVHVTVESLTTGERTALDADALVCATGYRPADPFPLLGAVAQQCRRDELGRPAVERDYRVATGPDLRCGIYLQGGTEHSHGITSSLLSNTAVRAGEILHSITARRAAAGRQQRASGVPA